jgi:hypothetical protein
MSYQKVISATLFLTICSKITIKPLFKEGSVYNRLKCFKTNKIIKFMIKY